MRKLNLVVFTCTFINSSALTILSAYTATIAPIAWPFVLLTILSFLASIYTAYGLIDTISEPRRPDSFRL